MSEISRDLFSILLALGGIIFLAGMCVFAAKEYKWGAILLIGGAVLIIVGATGQDSAQTRIDLARARADLATEQERNEILTERLARTRDHGGSLDEAVVKEAADAISFAAYISGLGIASSLLGIADKRGKTSKNLLGAFSKLLNALANLGMVAAWGWAVVTLGRVALVGSTTILMAAININLMRLAIGGLASFFDVAASLLLWFANRFPDEED